MKRKGLEVTSFPEAGGHREMWTSASNRRSSAGRIRDRKRSGRDRAFQDPKGAGLGVGTGDALVLGRWGDWGNHHSI